MVARSVRWLRSPNALRVGPVTMSKEIESAMSCSLCLGLPDDLVDLQQPVERHRWRILDVAQRQPEANQLVGAQLGRQISGAGGAALKRCLQPLQGPVGRCWSGDGEKSGIRSAMSGAHASRSAT